MMVEVDTKSCGVLLVSLDRIHSVAAHPDLSDEEGDGLAVIKVGEDKTIILKQSMVSFKRVLDGGGVKIIRGG